MGHGYSETILRVDLTSGSTSVETFDEPFYRQYPGGKALATYHLLRELAPGIDVEEVRAKTGPDFTTDLISAR